MTKLKASDIVALYERQKGIVDPADSATGPGQIPSDEALRRRGIPVPGDAPPNLEPPVTARSAGPKTPGSTLPSYNPAPEQPDTFKDKPFDQLSMAERIEYSYLRQKAERFRMPLGVIRYASEVDESDIEAFRKKHKNASKDTEMIRFAIASQRFREAGGSFLHEGQLDPGDSLEAHAQDDLSRVDALTQYTSSQRAALFRPFARGTMGTIATALRAAGFDGEAEQFDRLADQEQVALERGTYDSAAGSAGSMTGSVIPTVAAVGSAAISTPAVMTYYAITAFGNEGQDYRKEMDRRGLEPSLQDEILHSTGAMATEFIAERLGIGALRVIPDKVAGALFKEVGDGLLKNSAKKAAKAITGYATAAPIEGIEEGLTELLNNTRKGLTYSPETGVWDNVPEAFMGGAVGGVVAQNANMVRRGVEGMRRDRQVSRMQDRQSARSALGAMSPDNAQRGLEGAEQQAQLDAQTQALRVDAQNREAANADTGSGEKKAGQNIPENIPQTATPKDIVLEQFERNPDLPKPSYLTEDGVALFNDEGAARAYAATVEGAQVDRVLGSDTWSVTNPQAKQARPVADNETPSGDTQAGSSVTGDQATQTAVAEVDETANPTRNVSRNFSDSPDSAVGTGQLVSATVFRGATPGRDTVADGAQFYTPNRAVAVSYAGETGEVTESTIEFKNALVSENWQQAKKQLSLPASAPMRKLLETARSQGYDGVVFEKHANGPEYVALAATDDSTNPGSSPEQPDDASAPARSPGPEPGTVAVSERTPESGQRTGQDASQQDTAPAVESRTEPRRTEVPPRAELAAMPFAQVRKVATELGIPEKPYRSKQKLIEAIEQRGETEQVQEPAQEGQTDTPEFDPADMPPVVRNRLQRLGQRMIDQAEARQKARASTLYSNPIPSVLDVAAWSVGHVIRTAGDVAQFTADFKKRFGDAFEDEDIAMFHEEATREAENKQVAKYLKAHEQKSKASTKNIVRTTTGQTDTSPEVKTTERKALRDKLRTEQRAANKAYRAGVKSITDTLPALISTAKEGEKLKGKAQDAVRDGIRKQIRRMVEQSIPLERRGKFLSDITNAKTMTDLIQSMEKMQRESARSSAAESARKIKAIAGPKALQKLDNETRKQVRELLAQAKPHEETRKAFGQGRVENNISTDDLVHAARELERIHNEIAEIVGYYKAMKKKFGAQTKLTRDEHVRNVVANIKSAKPTVRSESGSVTVDPALSVIRRAATAISDSRLLVRTIEGKTDGSAVLEEMIYGNAEGSVVYGEDKHLLQRAGDQNRLNSLAVKAGWRNLKQAMARTVRNSGRGTVRQLEVTIGGEPTTITLGEAMHIYAMDEQTRALFASGVPGQFENSESRNLAVTVEELDAIAAKLTDEQRAFVDGVKAMMEENSEQAFAAVKELKGYEPERVPGYFPRRRRTGQSENAGLPEIARDGTVTRYLENLGFTKQREQQGGPKSSPIVIGDFLTIANNHLDGLSKLSHLAVPIRNASAVLLAPEVQRSITDRHGKDRLEALKTNLAHMSRANSNQSTRGARIVAHANTNATIAMLGLNPGTWLRQLAGSVRMAPLMDPRDLAAGLKSVASIDTEQMVSESGFFWERYVGNMTGRFSSVVEGNTADVADDRVRDVFARGWENFKAGDLGAALSSARTAAQKPLEIMNWFDSMNARIAWGAMQNRVEREHPDWSEDQKRQWVAIEAASLVRRTQNSASPIDASHLANSVRNTAWSFAFLFKSEVARARNRIFEGFQESKSAGAAALAAEMVNIGLSAILIDGAYDAMSVAMASLLSGDFDDFWERMFAAMMPDDYAPNRIVSDIAGSLVEPYATPAIIDAWSKWNTQLSMDSPAMDLVGDTMRGFKGMYKEFSKLFNDKDFDTGKFLRSLENSVNSGMGASGLNPFYAPYSKVRRDMDKLEKARENAVPSRY